MSSIPTARHSHLQLKGLNTRVDLSCPRASRYYSPVPRERGEMFEWFGERYESARRYAEVPGEVD